MRVKCTVTDARYLQISVWLNLLHIHVLLGLFKACLAVVVGFVGCPESVVQWAQVLMWGQAGDAVHEQREKAVLH